MSDDGSRPPRPQERPSFLEELKRRRVPRVAIVYLAAGFAIVEAADIALPRLGLPDWTITLVLALLLLGFPLVIGISWAFDWTPDGLVKAPAPGPRVLESRDEAADRSRIAWFGPRTVGAAAVFLALGVGIAGGWLIRPAMVDTVAVRDGPPKVAVLPFRNASIGDDDNASLALGIHDDLLTRISRIRDLRVISRTSVMDYADTQLSIPEIARELGADVVLEGGVQRAGSSVRINVQLIDGRTDEHLWAETYDRDFDMEQLFRTQSEIAERVAVELEATLSPDESAAIASVPTTDSMALRLYRNAWPAYDDVNNEVALRAAIAQLETAVERDPEFAEAWSLMSIFHADMNWFGHEQTEARIQAGFDAAEQALGLDPELPLAHVALGNAHYHGRSEYGPAAAAYERALELDPSSGDALLGIGTVLRRQGRMFEALDALERGLDLDPRSIALLTTVGETLEYVRRFDAADSVLATIVSRDPTQISSWIFGPFARHSRLNTVPLADAVEAIDRVETLGAAELASELRVNLGVRSRDTALFERGISGLPADHVFAGQYRWTPIELAHAVRAYADGDRERQRAQASRAAERLEAWLESRPDDERAWSELAISRAVEGDFDAALRASDRTLALMPLERDFLKGVEHLRGRAAVLGLAGRPDEAFEILERMVDLPAGGTFSPHLLDSDPLFGPLRGDPRWAPVLERLSEALPGPTG